MENQQRWWVKAVVEIEKMRGIERLDAGLHLA